MNITILTPSYNRGGGLQRLYDSLTKQTNKDFAWFVVDDGSTDNTSELVESFIKEADFPISYFPKENGGKCSALNLGISKIETELTFIVDSDDYLTEDAIETILQYHEKYKNKDYLCGYSFLRKHPDGKINGKLFPKDEMIDNYIDARINADDTLSDKAEVWYTSCLKEFPFPEYPNENFLGEDIVWIPMALKYDMVHINKAIYIGDYQTDGLTKNRRKHNIENPVGCVHRAIVHLIPQIKLKYRIKAAMQCIIYGKFAHYSLKRLMKESHKKLILILVYLPSYILYRKWKKAYQT